MPPKKDKKQGPYDPVALPSEGTKTKVPGFSLDFGLRCQ